MKLFKTIIFVIFLLLLSETLGDPFKFSSQDVLKYRNEVRKMFYHAYDSYMEHAYPFDELRPLTCDGYDTWGSYSLTLIDALDTLAVMENKTEFQKVVNLIVERKDFEADINVSVFETNIRIVGGLLSGHLLSRKMGIELESGWPCEGPLLRLAVDAANRLLPAFDTPTGMPYGTVNLKTGVPEGETPITCSAGVGTFIIEFGTISRLTGDPMYENVALRAIHALWNRRSKLDLIGNHIDVVSGLWTANDAGIGAGVDSFFEYLAKGSFLLQRPELMSIFNDARRAIDRHLRHEDWYLWKSMQRGQLTMAVFQSLEAFWPGILTLVGELDSAKKTIFNYHQVLSQYGFHPEFYNIPQGSAYVKRSGYPLRPEFVESLVYLYQATKDSTYLKMGADLVRSINHSARTPCGYATVENVIDHSLDNRMESFFLAETTKYLYLLFNEDHWLLSSGAQGRPITVNGRLCVVEAGGYFFNTEAHPMDTGALSCCTGPKISDMFLPKKEMAQFILHPTRIPNTNSISSPFKLKPDQPRSSVNYKNIEIIPPVKADFGQAMMPQGPNKYDGTLVELTASQTSPKKHFKYNLEKPLETINNALEVTEEPEDTQAINSFQSLKVETDDHSTNEYKNLNKVKSFIDINDNLESNSPLKTPKIPTDAENEPQTLKESIDHFPPDDDHFPPGDDHFPPDDDHFPPDDVIQSAGVDDDQKEDFETITTENDTKNKYDSENIARIKEAIVVKKTENLPWNPMNLGTKVETPDGSFSSGIPEISGIATSVSSSKSVSRATSDNRIIDKEPIVPPISLRRIFSLDLFRQKLTDDIFMYKNFTESVSYSTLRCPVETFVESLSFKGLMVNIEDSHG